MVDRERIQLALSYRNDLRACTACELHKECRSPVPWNGDFDPEIAVIGEAPGASEDRAGIPFVGSAGQFLRTAFRKSGIDPEAVTYVNACNCFPGSTIRNPETRHVNACRKWMRGQIALIRPKFVLTVGVVALHSVRPLNKPKLASLRGKPLFWDTPPAPASPEALWSTWHPSAARRFGGKVNRQFQEDIYAFAQWIKDPDRKRPEDCYLCGDEMYRVDEWGIVYCERHAAFQQMLWPEDMAELSSN